MAGARLGRTTGTTGAVVGIITGSGVGGVTMVVVVVVEGVNPIGNMTRPGCMTGSRQVTGPPAARGGRRRRRLARR